jgi:DNA repair photolyase
MIFYFHPNPEESHCMPDRPSPHGRGSHIRPTNRFTLRTVEPDLDALDGDELARLARPETRYLVERAGGIVSENDSPDIPFRYSVNPYRGCLHGCAYCYARPTHEYLGYDAGLDFETKIVVKENAPGLFRDWLARPRYAPEPIMFSGVTDCYQPCERDYRVTRGCLEVALEARQPISLITKNALVLRDLDLLAEMASLNLLHAAVSVTTLDADLARVMEPRTSAPEARLRAIRELAAAGIPTRVMVAPVIPGLNDSEVPAVLEAARDAGAHAAGHVLLRLPLTVEPVFLEWVDRCRPDMRAKLEGRLRAARGGRLNDPRFGARMRGEGPMAEQIHTLVRLFKKRLGLDRTLPDYDTSRFRPPRPTSGQLWLF